MKINVKYSNFLDDGPESKSWVAVAYRYKKDSPWHIYDGDAALYNINQTKTFAEELISEVMEATGASRNNIRFVKPKFVMCEVCQ